MFPLQVYIFIPSPPHTHSTPMHRGGRPDEPILSLFVAWCVVRLSHLKPHILQQTGSKLGDNVSVNKLLSGSVAHSIYMRTVYYTPLACHTWRHIYGDVMDALCSPHWTLVLKRDLRTGGIWERYGGCTLMIFELLMKRNPPPRTHTWKPICPRLFCLLLARKCVANFVNIAGKQLNAEMTNSQEHYLPVS